MLTIGGQQHFHPFSRTVPHVLAPFPTFWQILAPNAAETALFLSMTEEFSKTFTYYCSSVSKLVDDWVLSLF